jgi:hypothetical protein
MTFAGFGELRGRTCKAKLSLYSENLLILHVWVGLKRKSKVVAKLFVCESSKDP